MVINLKSVIRCSCLAVLSARLESAEPPPSPAKLNIRPVYDGLLLPDSYVPKDFRLDSPSVSANPSNPPRKSGSYQSFIWEVPHPSMGGKISLGSNVDDWKRVSLSDCKVYPTVKDAQGYFAYTAYFRSVSRKVDVGDEALFTEWDERPWHKPTTDYSRKLHDKDHEWDSRSTRGVIRIGRIVFEINVSGRLMIDRVDVDTGKGFTTLIGMATIREAPSREDLEGCVKKFAAGITAYAGSMNLLKDDPANKSDSGKPQDLRRVICPAGNCRLTKEECENARRKLGSLWPCKGGSGTSSHPAGQPVDPDGAGSGQDDGKTVTAAPEPFDDSETDGDGGGSPVSPGEAAGATAAAGIVAAIGSLLFTRAMGVNISDYKDAWDVITGADQTPAVPPPMPPELPPTLPEPVQHYDGEVNENGEVWSINQGFVPPDEYQRDLATRRMIDRVNSGVNMQSDQTARELGRALGESQRKLEDMQETGRFVDLSTQLADRFGTTEEKIWCREFIERHAKAGPNGYEMDPETARQMYSGLKKQMYTSRQIANMAETEYQLAVDGEVGRKTEVVIQIRDNAKRINRLLARFDPTGTGQKIVGFQQNLYGAIEGYEQGGIAGAAESAVLSVADNYTQGHASTNYNALKDAYAEQGISDESVAARMARANFEAANNKYNALDHAGKAVSHLMDGDYGAAADSALDGMDARDSLKDDYGKGKDWATKPKPDTPDKVPHPQADTVPDTAPDAGKKSLGTMRRESFEETRKSFEKETEMMKKLNEIADMPDPAQQQAALIKARQSDPSLFNVVQKQLHPETVAKVTEANKALSDAVVERQAQVLKEMGFDPQVRLTGKPGGADTDGYWTLKDKDGNVLADSETRKLAEDALKKASDEVLKPLGTDADQMGHKVMNDSPEKFAGDPNDLGIKSKDGKLENGKLGFSDHEKTGDHWKKTDRESALTPHKDRISDAAMTKDNAASLGEVMKTKTAHLEDIARNKGAVTESDMRDLARELTKTNERTFLPMAQKAGVKPTREYRDLMQKLMLLKHGEISSGQLPPVSDINRIIQENVGSLHDAI